MAIKYDDFYYPLGRGSAAMNFSSKIKELKDKYFDKVIKDILVSCVYSSSKDRYSFFFKIPSEQNETYPTAVMYDVILEFNPDPKNKSACKNSSTLKNYDIFIYSNSPGFVFTFDYVIKHKHHAFPKGMNQNLISKVAITKAPEIRNRMEVMTLEKTTWWSLYHLDYNGYLDKATLKALISKKPESFFYKQVASQPVKLQEINSLKKMIKEEKQKALVKKNDKLKKSYIAADKNNKMTESAKTSLKSKLISNLKTNSMKHSMKVNFNHTFKNPVNNLKSKNK